MVTTVRDRQIEQDVLLVRGMRFVDKFINKNYLIGLDMFPTVEPNCDISRYAGLRLFHLRKISFEATDDMTSLLISVYGALHSLMVTAIIIIDAHPDDIDFYIGVSSDFDASVAGLVLEKGIRGNFPGSDLERLRGSEIKEKMNEMTSTKDGSCKSIASVSIVPTMRGESDAFMQGIERFVDALMGETYVAFFISEPIDQNDIERRKRGFEQLYSTLSPFQKTSLAYGDNMSNAVSEGVFTSFSNSINSAITNTNTEGQTANWTASRGSSYSHSTGGATYGGNWSMNSSHSESYGTSTSWSRSVTQGRSSTTSEGVNAGKTNTLSDSRTLTINYENKTVSDLLAHIANHLDRIKESEVYGWWMSGAYFLSDDMQTSVIAANTYRALIAGDNSRVENAFINTWDAVRNAQAQKIIRYLQCGKHPIFSLPAIGQFEAQNVKAVHMISGKEIPIFSGFPQHSIVGMVVDNMASFGQEVLTVAGARPRSDFEIGRVVHKGVIENRRVSMDPEVFRSHCFITGSTGSGKSNTVYRLLQNFIDRGINFLIIEPAKGEYKYSFGALEKINIFWTNPNIYPMLRINPFSFPDNIHVLEHLDRLIEIFNACWPLYAAMPAILKSAVEQAYINCGWDLVRSIHFPNGKGKFPTFSDLLFVLPMIISESSYSSQSKGDYTGALVTRVESLAKGIMGQVFCSKLEIVSEILFDKNTIIDLSRIGSTETKSLLMGVLIMKLNEYRMATVIDENIPLRHITVLEEAHNLLRNTQDISSSGTGGSVMAKSVEMISNSIAEMRTYGEGFIIVDQSPTSVDISAIKNTNTKIVMRLPDKNDQEVIGNAFALTPIQIREISRLDVGSAVVGQNGWLQPVMVKIDAASKKYYGRENALTKDIERRIVVGRLAVQLMDQQSEDSFSRTVLRRSIMTSDLSERKKQELLRMIGSFIDSYSDCCDLFSFLMELLECEGLFDVYPLRLSKGEHFTESDDKSLRLWFPVIMEKIDHYVLMPEPITKEKNRLFWCLIAHFAFTERNANYIKLYRHYKRR